jgi:bacillopeptidase F
MKTTRILNLLYCFLLLVLIPVPVQSADLHVGPRLQAALASVAPNEKIPVIIRLSEQLDLANYRHLPKKERRRQLVQELRATSGRSQKELRKLLRQVGVRKIKDLWHINALAIDADPALIAAIASRPEVASVTLDGLVALPPAQLAAVATPEWNLDAIGITELRTQLPGLTGAGITVATIDTGVDGSHFDLSNWRGQAGDWLDFRAIVSSSPEDAEGHGTAVMGVLAGTNLGIDNIGVAPGALWIASNPFAIDKTSYGDLHSSFAWALDPDGNGDGVDAPDIVNNSWALENSGTCSIEFQDDIDRLKEADIGVVFAAGNSGPDPSTSQSPANNPNTVAVGATDPDGEVAWFSSRGNSAWTSFSGGGYGFVDGTSFSAPHVSGVMALLMQAYPSATVTDIETAMTESAVDLGPVGPDPDYGYGQLQAMNAWRYLKVGGEPILSIHDPSAPENDHFLDFGNVAPGASQVRELTLRNAGSADLLLSAIDFTGLTAEISLVSDVCSNVTLAADATCAVSLQFSPPDFSAYGASLSIGSNDPVDATVSVTFAGTGNTPPPAATLLLPHDGETNVAQPVVFSWTQSADIDGDVITNALLISETPGFIPFNPIDIIAAATGSNTILFAGCGLLAAAALLRRRHLPLLLISLTTLLVLSCGGGGGSGGVIVGDVISYEHAGGLKTNTTYYWKVQSTDSRGAVVESTVRSFTTSIFP